MRRGLIAIQGAHRLLFAADKEILKWKPDAWVPIESGTRAKTNSRPDAHHGNSPTSVVLACKLILCHRTVSPAIGSFACTRVTMSARDADMRNTSRRIYLSSARPVRAKPTNNLIEYHSAMLRGCHTAAQCLSQVRLVHGGIGNWALAANLSPNGPIFPRRTGIGIAVGLQSCLKS